MDFTNKCIFSAYSPVGVADLYQGVDDYSDRGTEKVPLVIDRHQPVNELAKNEKRTGLYTYTCRLCSTNICRRKDSDKRIIFDDEVDDDVSDYYL